MSEFVESVKRLYHGDSEVINDEKLNKWLGNKTITQEEYNYIISN